MALSAAGWFSLSTAEFKERANVILVTDGLGKDTERCVLLLGTAIFNIRSRLL